METSQTSQSPSQQKNIATPFFHGFTDHALHHGPHICQIYTTPNERMNAVVDFLTAGIQSGDQTYCIAETPTDDLLNDYLAASGISLSKVTESGQFHAITNQAFYLKDGIFDFQKTLDKWDKIIASVEPKTPSRPWAIADVLPELRYLQGGTQLIIYESRLNEWMHHHNATIVCQYDARVFDGCTIMGMLRIHPLVLANRKVMANPFFVPVDKSKSN